MYWLFNHYEAGIFHCWQICSKLCRRKQSMRIFYWQCLIPTHYCYYSHRRIRIGLICCVGGSHTQPQSRGAGLISLWLRQCEDSLYGAFTNLKSDRLNFAYSYMKVWQGSNCEYFLGATEEISLAYQLQSRRLRLPLLWEGRFWWYISQLTQHNFLYCNRGPRALHGLFFRRMDCWRSPPSKRWWTKGLWGSEDIRCLLLGCFRVQLGGTQLWGGSY